jgi:hypothetical protein
LAKIANDEMNGLEAGHVKAVINHAGGTMLQLNRTVLALAFASTALGITACQQQELPIGDDGAGQSALLVAQWDGYIENFKFRSGSDVIRVNISSVQGTTITGTVRFGTSTTVPAATDPLVGYPSGPDSAGGYEVRLPFEGHDYAIQDAVLTDHRLHFSINPLDLWKDWCEMQTPHVYGSAGILYSCAPNGYSISGNTCSHVDVPADCGYTLLCQQSTQVCACAAAGCTSSVGEKLDFDVAVDAQEANGSVVGLAGLPFQPYQPRPVNAFNIRLTRGN